MTKKEQMTIEEAYKIVEEHENKLYWDGLNKEVDTYLKKHPKGSTIELHNIQKCDDTEILLQQRGYNTTSWFNAENMSVMLKYSKKQTKKTKDK